MEVYNMKKKKSNCNESVKSKDQKFIVEKVKNSGVEVVDSVLFEDETGEILNVPVIEWDDLPKVFPQGTIPVIDFGQYTDEERENLQWPPKPQVQTKKLKKEKAKKSKKKTK